jgi:hypothetical protein
MRRLKPIAVAFIVVFAAAQLVRPDRVNPPTDPSRTIQAHVASNSGLVAVLDRACGDCHSNATVWPWYTHVAVTGVSRKPKEHGSNTVFKRLRDPRVPGVPGQPQRE